MLNGSSPALPDMRPAHLWRAFVFLGLSPPCSRPGNPARLTPHSALSGSGCQHRSTPGLFGIKGQCLVPGRLGAPELNARRGPMSVYDMEPSCCGAVARRTYSAVAWQEDAAVAFQHHPAVMLGRDDVAVLSRYHAVPLRCLNALVLPCCSRTTP